jgi:Effector-associated domain 7
MSKIQMIEKLLEAHEYAICAGEPEECARQFIFWMNHVASSLASAGMVNEYKMWKEAEETVRFHDDDSSFPAQSESMKAILVGILGKLNESKESGIVNPDRINELRAISSPQSKVTRIEALLRRTYDLVEYARVKRDKAPIALGDYPGHVGEDRNFHNQVQQLKSDIKSLLDEDDSLEYPRFVSKLERLTPSVSPGQSPVWNRLARCRCWWDAKDELQAIADYLETLRVDQKKSSSEDISSERAPQIGINTEAVRELLMAAFDDTDLMTLCFDRFYLVYNEKFGEGMSKGKKVQSLLDYCVRRGLLEALVGLVKEQNPHQYNIYANRIFTI